MSERLIDGRRSGGGGDMDRVSWIRITGAAAVVGAVFWAVKWVAIALQGYSGSALDVPAFFLGLAGVVVGSCSLALRRTAGRGPVVTTVGCLIGAIVALLLVPGLSIVSSGLFGDDTFVGSEGGLILLAAVAVVIGLTGLRTTAVVRQSYGAAAS